MKEWKLSIFNIVDKRIKFYSQNTNLLPPKSKRKAMNRNWYNQKANPALNTKAGNKYILQIDKIQ